MTGRVARHDPRPELTGQLPEVIAEGGYYGMQTFDQHLLKHLQAGRITFEEAMRSPPRPHDFKLLVAAEGTLSETAAPAAEPQITADFSAAPAAPAPSAAPPAPSAPPPGMTY